MKNIFSFIIPLVAVFSNLYAQSADDNIVINSKKEFYTYKIASDNVFLESISNTELECLKWPETIHEVEFYDVSSEIIRAEANNPKRITPVYQMYQRDGVFYSDTKMCYFNLYFSGKGSKANVVFEKRYNDVGMINKVLLFESQFVKQKVVEIIVPEKMQVSIIEMNFADNIETTRTVDLKSGATRYTYTIKNQKAFVSQRDTPGYYLTEPYLLLIPKKAVVKKGEKVFFENYADVYKWCIDKSDRTENDMEVVKEFTDQLLENYETEDEKIAKIFSWVQEHIRYLAFEYGLSGWVPDNAQNVLKKRYGDCKGMSNLLKTMLQSQGFDARLAWIGTRSIYSTQEIPLPLFNHMICALFRNDSIIYLDPTVAYMTLGEYHDGIQGRFTMIEDGNNYIIDSVPKIMPSQNIDRLLCHYRIENNTLVGEVSMQLSGENKEAIMYQIHALESAVRLNVLKQFLEKRNPKHKVEQITLKESGSKHKAIQINYKETRSGSINKLDDEIYIDLDSRQDYIHSLIDTIKRKADILLPFKELLIREEYLELPLGYEIIALPDSLYIDNENYTAMIRYSSENNKIRYYKEIKLKNTWIKRQNFRQWNDDILKLKKNYLTQIILRNTQKPVE